MPTRAHASGAPPSRKELQVKPQNLKIKAYLALRGKTVALFAEHYGCSRQFAYAVIWGAKPAPDRFKSALADYLGVFVEDLFPDDGEGPAPKDRPLESPREGIAV